MIGFRGAGLAVVLMSLVAVEASARDVSDIVGRWDCSFSNRAEKLNARTYFTVEQNGAASIAGTIQVVGDEGVLKIQFKGAVTVGVEGNKFFETPVSSTVLSASLDGQEINEAGKQQIQASLMNPYDGPAQILSLSSQNFVYERDGTITDCELRD